MNTDDIARSIEGLDSHVSLDKRRQVVKMVIDSFTSAMVRGEDITLPHYGTFRVKRREARKGRNPQTGEAIIIAAKNVVEFSPAKALREAGNQPDEVVDFGKRRRA